MTILSDIIRNASNKPAYSAVIEQEEVRRRVMAEPQQDLKHLSLRNLMVRDTLNIGPDAVLSNSNPNDVLPEPGTPGIKSRIAAEVIALSSRTVKAGANIVLIQDAPSPKKSSTGEIYMVSQPGGFAVAEPAQFSLVLDGAAASDSPVPVYRSLMDRSTAPTYFFRTILTRREQKSWMDDQLEASLLSAIMLGIGSVVDKVLLEAIMVSGPNEDPETPAQPTAFTIAKAAARGLSIDSLRALIGTSGTSASFNGNAFNGNGKLVAEGIIAELTNQMEGTLIGDFSRAAVGVMEDITLIAQRVNYLEGETAVTCICNAKALLPHAQTNLLPFWTAA